MTIAEQILVSVASAVAGGYLMHLFKEWRAQAKKGRQVEEHKNFITREECERCASDHQSEMTMGGELFRLILEGLSLNTQALILLCDRDDGCRELRARLQEFLNRLASRQIEGR